jgi:hypothetical protein
MKSFRTYGLRILMLCCLMAVSLQVFATHQRAGEISYVYVSGLTYEFTITTYTYTPSLADRPEIDITWGDGTVTTVPRTLKINMENDISKNVYVTRHTFPASGTFYVSFEDPNRNAGIVNIPSSVEVPFFIETMIVINPFVGGNSSPQLMNPPIDNGCTGVTYYHNPGAYDPDGDSLSYSLVDCRGYEGEVIPGYQLPYASNYIAIDPVTGDLVWETPTMAGEFNIAILIQEWRNGILISSMVRDMQITIAPCNNQPPVILVHDTCVLAGTQLHLPIQVFDNTSTHVTLSATGEPLYLSDGPAQFMQITDSVAYTTFFHWNTQCSHVRTSPYEVLFKAKDNGPQVELVSFRTLRITIVAPKPENLVAIPEGNVVHLSWSPDSCPNAVGYDIYRRNGSNPFEPGYCETGMPYGTGYQWIGRTSSWDDTLYTDDGFHLPLYHANDYCYRVVALFPDGAESYVSDEACTHIFNDAPLIINADVVTTDDQHGTLYVRWIAPPELDSVTFSPPYFYNLYRKSGNDDGWTLLNNNPFPFIGSDTSDYLDHDIDTRNMPYTYRVEFYNNDTVIEYSDPAASIFLTAEPGDRRMSLSWQVRQPWNNVAYTIYRHNDVNDAWDSIATVEGTQYVDQGLDNSQTYCYFVCAEGYYWIPDTVGPLYNRSQVTCDMPVDNQPPEIPQLTITTDCSAVTYEWTFSSDSTASDAFYYYIYYKPTLEGEFVCIDSFTNNLNTCYPMPCVYQLTSDVIVGCFAMAVSDTNRNRTELSDSTCIDIYECLDYRLPNVFTPNGDGYNDVFRPFDPYHGVSKVDMVIYNRWGKRVFHTQDPAILWDGTEETTHQICSDGVYYYVCNVYVNTLTGEFFYPLHGSVTLIK